MTAPATVGIVSAGDMGAALAVSLREGGHRIVTCVAGRGPATGARAAEAGMEPLGSRAEVAGAADVVLSLVPPSRAVDAAREYRGAAGAARPGQIFVDANSVSPATAREVAHQLAGTPVAVVDGAVYGSAARVAANGALLLSGAEAPRAAAMLAGGPRVLVVGDAVGDASTRKMLLAGLTKGLCALVLEVGALADAAGALDASLDDYREYYPGVMELVDRMLPTYRQHAPRRADELGELVALAADLGLDAGLLGAAEGVTRALGTPHPGDGAPGSRVIDAVSSRSAG